MNENDFWQKIHYSSLCESVKKNHVLDVKHTQSKLYKWKYLIFLYRKDKYNPQLLSTR